MGVRVEAHAEPIPGYTLIDRLGGGGFGEVWRANAPGGIHKAIKFVYGDLGSAGDSDQRAKQEMKALERVKNVRHPYILSLERYEVIDGQLVIVMELADRNLWDRYKEARAQGFPGIPREELLRYMEETAEALDLMNSEYQLQHLDIKPQNLFLIYNHVKVADFGLVKDLEGSQATVTGGITPVYAAPESFDGKVSRFSDQYSLAIVFQELLTGQRPFSGNNVRQLIMQHISAEPNVSPLPPADQAIIRRGLSKKPSERFPSCSEMIRLLRAATPGLVAAPPAGAPVSPSALTGVASVPPSWQGVVTPPPSSVPQTANMRGPAADTGSSQGATHCIRAIEQAVLSPSGSRAPAEVNGPGCLFPSLVVGLGQVGLTVLQKARDLVQRHVAPLTQLAHLRFLLFDTDPDVIRLAAKGPGSAGLTAGEVVLAQLNRPSYYLKPKDGRPALESWLNPRMLYRIPRSQVTTGVRALGRLAFLDNYRMIARRLQLELETLLEPASLQAAARQTKLGLRSNRPRVYVVSALGGGTGSGMLIDLAYTVRALLRQIGYENPDVVGLLLLPPVDGSRTKVMSLGNTYAALAELSHYAAPGTKFEARYHDRESAVQDAGPPFSRTVVLPFPDEGDEVATQELIDLCGQFLYRDLATPLGRAADLARAGLPSPPWEERGQYFQTFNLFQISWPRQALVQALGRQLCQRVVQRWGSKDSRPVREQAQQWVQDTWLNLELGADCFIQRVQAAVLKALGKQPEAVFQAIHDPLNKGSAQGEPPGRRSPRESRGLDPEQLASILQQLENLVGRPQEDHSHEDPPHMIRMLRDATEELGNEWSQKLAEVTVRLIEEPQYRLAGAEEALRQLIATIEQVLQHHEPLARDLAEKAAEAHEHLRVLSGGQPKEGKGRPRLTSAEQMELLRAYPKWRYQSLVLQYLASAFVGLRGHLSDELREVNFCRVRLAELQRLFDEPAPGEASLAANRKPKGTDSAIGHTLFLSGCKNLTDAVNLYMQGITADHLLELDARMEEMLRQGFTALVHVCLTSANILKDVYAAMLATAAEYAASHLPPTSVAELFFEQFTDPQEAEGEIGDCFNEAAPEIAVSRVPRGAVPPVELTLLATPGDAASEQFKALVKSSMPHADVTYAASTEDIIVYRERTNLALIDLEHMGATGHDAYVQMTANDNFTPHCRSDVDFRAK